MGGMGGSGALQSLVQNNPSIKNTPAFQNYLLGQTPGMFNGSTSNMDQSALNNYQNMFETGKGYGGAGDKPAVDYKDFLESTGQAPTYAQLGAGLNTASLGLDSYALDQAQPLLNEMGQQQSQQSQQLGQQQYDQTMAAIPGMVGNQMVLQNPALMESLNSTGQLNSSAYPTALAQEQAQLTSQLAMPALQQLQGTQTGALGQLQGFNTAGLQRYMGLEDFANQAQAAKVLGSNAAPSAPGKGAGTGALQGAAAGGTTGAAFGPWGAGIGAGLGAIGGATSAKGK